ncbi:hypothetical protein OXX69_002724 [Metschnikowia pulcherrima]
MIYRPLAFTALAALATAASQSSEQRSFTVNHYKNVSIVPSRDENPFLAISNEPFSVMPGSDDFFVEVPRTKMLHVWELTGFYDAKEAGEFTFFSWGCEIASIQIGFDSKEAKAFDEGAFKAAVDITSTPRPRNFKKGLNPIRVLYMSSEDITGLNRIPIFLVDGTNLNDNIFQPHYDSGDATEPVYKATGFHYRVFEEPQANVKTMIQFHRQYPNLTKIQEGYLDDSYNGVIIPGSLSPEAVEITGFIRVSEEGTYAVSAETGLSMMLQVGVGSSEKQTQYKINASWKSLDTRQESSVLDLDLLAGSYYPFRLVIVGSENTLKHAISQLGPSKSPMDFLGIWEIVPQSAGANPQVHDDKEVEKEVIPLIHQADPSQSAAATRPQDKPASDGHADNDGYPSLDHSPASLTGGFEKEKARESLDGADNGDVSKQPASAGEGAPASEKPEIQGGSSGSDQGESGPGSSEPKDELYGLNFSDRVKNGYRRLSLDNPSNAKSNVGSEDPQKNQSDECKNTGNACLPQPAVENQGNVDEKVTENPVGDSKDIAGSKKLNNNRAPADKKEEEKAPGGLVETKSGPSASRSKPTQASDQDLPLETLAPGINSVCNW